MSKVVLQETLRHREAFDFYYQLGHERSFEAVGREFGVSGNAVGIWAKSFGWTDKVKAMDEEIAAELDQKTKDAVKRQRTRILTTIESLIDRCVTTLPDGKVVPNFIVENVPDFERVVKMFLLLNGEATERSEINGNIDAREAVLSRLDRLYATAGPASNN